MCAHRLALHVAQRHLVGLVQVVSAVHAAPETRLLPDGVVRAELWGDHPQHSGGTIREDKRLENGPAKGAGSTGGRDRKERMMDSHPHHLRQNTRVSVTDFWPKPFNCRGKFYWLD